MTECQTSLSGYSFDFLSLRWNASPKLLKQVATIILLLLPALLRHIRLSVGEDITLVSSVFFKVTHWVVKQDWAVSHFMLHMRGDDIIRLCAPHETHCVGVAHCYMESRKCDLTLHY